MTAPTVSAPLPTRSTSPGRLTFGGTLRSEWIKLRTVRSTVWCYAIIVVLTALFGMLLANTGRGPGGPMPAEVQQSYAVQAATLSIGFSQLVASVLGVLVISGEYGTGMIRSTFTAVPRRIPALLAKAIVFAVATFSVGLIAIAVTTLVTAPMLPGVGIRPDFGDGALLLALGGGALYLALVGVMSLALGAIIRNSAGGIAASLGLLVVVPTVLQIFAAITQATWATTLAAFLPNAAGGKLYSYTAMGGSTGAPAGGAAAGPADGFVTLNALQGGLVLTAWVVTLMVVAALLLKRRDV